PPRPRGGPTARAPVAVSLAGASSEEGGLGGATGSGAPGPRGEAWAHEAVTTPPTTRRAQMDKVFGYVKGLHATYLIDLGGRLGLFARLAGNDAGTSPDALAGALGLHPEYVQFWCEAACALELLDYDPELGYRLAPYMDEVLGQPEATYYLGRFPETHLRVAH